VTLVTAIGLGLFLGEQLLRLAGYEYRPVSIDPQKTEDARYYHLFAGESFVYDPDLIWKPRAGEVPFNEQGFRGPLMPISGRDGRDGRRLLVAIGDSNTLGWAGSDGANWPLALGGLLADSKVDVVNAGVWGYSSLQGVARLRQVLAFEPDVVLLSFGSNDAIRVRLSDREFARRGAMLRGLERRLVHYRLGQLTIAAAQALAGGGDEPVERVPQGQYRVNLREMVELARVAGAEPVLLTRPYELPSQSDDWWKNEAAAYNRATVEVALAAGAQVVDFYTHFKGRRDYFADESHFTDAGHERAARIAELELAPLLARLSGAE
jgi:lysophospholipase L1-like esterase